MDSITTNNRKKFLSVNTYLGQTCDGTFDPESEVYIHMGGQYSLETHGDPRPDYGDICRSDPDYERTATYRLHDGGGLTTHDTHPSEPPVPCSGWISPDRRTGRY